MSTMRRAEEKIACLCARPRDLVSLWREATEVLVTAVPHWWTPCWYTLDPASLLMTSHFHDGLDEFPRQWLASEYYAEDVNQITDVCGRHRASRRCTKPPAASRRAVQAGTGT
jgi:hypothetical protein